MPPQLEALGSPVGVLGHGPGVRVGVADIFSLSNELLRLLSLEVDVEVFEAWEFLIGVAVAVTVTVTDVRTARATAGASPFPSSPSL